ncbi:MAG: hypothetical protein INQ03_14525 [Candidatus Heimdallarchaeota archaeon]|nr:hypothetical protein [Candidatus Heimdallarchaeota archaeon]
MVSEIQIIEKSGIPIYYYSDLVVDDADNRMYLEAGFFTAITQFALELNQGEIKSIALEQKTYLLSKTPEVILIYSTDENNLREDIRSIGETSSFISLSVTKYNISSSSSNKEFEPFINDVNKYLKEQGLIKDEGQQYTGVRDKVQSLVFKSVGYNPGECNIGPQQKLMRLSAGLGFTILSIILFGAMVLFNLSNLLLIPLFIINFFAVQQYVQVRANFCIANALMGQYNMN